MFGNIWEAIKTHKWVAIGIGGAVIVGVVIYAVTHKSSSSSTNNAQDLLATPGSGPTGVIGSGDGSAGGGGGFPAVNPANPAVGASGVDGSNPTTFTPVPTINVNPVSFTGPTVNPAPPSTAFTLPANEPSIPVGLSGVNYTPTANTPNQLVVGSANGLTSIGLPAGETAQSLVSVPNAAAGNPVVPLSDLVSTGSTNTLSSAYGTAASSAALVGDTSQLSSEGGQAAALALAQQQINFANTGSAVAKTTPVSTAPAGSTKIIANTPAKTTVQATSSTGTKTVVSTAPAAGHVGIMKPS
jgi:hypothetical protein